ncbi:hypothetical protein QBC34DRAFT_409003 [Podospora aff. communis PSN243]|uniref:Uncharacterized protein n=1 Tax=Podospora aff. communis PSN243 TaxID=3040156 RepID=A0AAV9GH59_9PEZI|nr:hypothetical protein QBC34DRAFT_409003 [Podospora aff. communis PSN243]
MTQCAGASRAKPPLNSRPPLPDVVFFHVYLNSNPPQRKMPAILPRILNRFSRLNLFSRRDHSSKVSASSTTASSSSTNMSFPHPTGRVKSKSDETEPGRQSRQSSRPASRYTSSPDVWESSYVDIFDDEDEPEYTTRPSPPPPAGRNHAGTFTNPWNSSHLPSRSHQRRVSHVRAPAWVTHQQPPTTTRGRTDSQSKRQSTTPATQGPYRSSSRNSRAQKRWESDYLRVFEKEYAEDHNSNRRNSAATPCYKPATPDLRMSGALPIPRANSSSSSSRPSRLSRHERQEQRARTAEWAQGDDRGQRAHHHQGRRGPSNDDQDAQLAEAMQQSLRCFASEEQQQQQQGKRRRQRHSLTPWYRQRGRVGNPVDEALKERVARRVDEQNREIERRSREGVAAQGGGRSKVRKVRFPDEA